MPVQALCITYPKGLLTARIPDFDTIAIHCKHYKYHCSSRASISGQRDLYQFSHMKTVLIYLFFIYLFIFFFGGGGGGGGVKARFKGSRTALSKYLANEVEILEERDFQSIKLISGMQSNVEERAH